MTRRMPRSSDFFLEIGTPLSPADQKNGFFACEISTAFRHPIYELKPKAFLGDFPLHEFGEMEKNFAFFPAAGHFLDQGVILEFILQNAITEISCLQENFAVQGFSFTVLHLTHMMVDLLDIGTDQSD